MKKLAIFAAVSAALLMLAPTAWAHDAGDWYVRLGYTNVDPDDPNGDIDLGLVDPALPVADIEVDDDWSVTFTGSYHFTENWAIELLAAVPFEHDIKVEGLGKVGSTKHLPPTLSLQYHFLPKATIQPYVGAGVNYTLFFDDEEAGALEAIGGSLSIEDNSFGLAGQIGADWIINNNWFINVDLRYIAIDTEADVTVPLATGGFGTVSEDVEIDPWVYGINVGYKF